MIHRASVAVLATHTVTNQPPDFAPRDLWQTDPALREAVPGRRVACHLYEQSEVGA